MWGKRSFALAGLLLLITLSQHARAVVDPIPPSTVPPPPGQFSISFPTVPPDEFDRERIQFRGTARADGLTSHAQITYRLFWQLPSGELEYLFPIIHGLDPSLTTGMDVTTTVDGCPTLVGVEFSTTSLVGATVSGTFDHQCTIPEPRTFALSAVMGGCLALATRRVRPTGKTGTFLTIVNQECPL